MTAWNHDYDQFRKRRKDAAITEAENVLIKEIKERVKLYNVDNISRTDAYKEFYRAHSDIPWSFLASMVSRNAGWNMTDLEGIYLPKLLSTSMRKRLFLTYERANWLIFEDAYPQLLIYERSLQLQRPQFHLLRAFSVSVFMEGEWERFWKNKDIERLMTAQIINEQYVIQATVIEHPYFQKHVFESLIFQLQELFHFSSVIFPALSGKLYGFSVHEFVQVKKRIELGKKLAMLLFHSSYYSMFTSFSDKTVHTGSRIDYEQYMGKKEPDSPYLRDVFPVISHHRHENDDWFEKGMDVSALFAPVSVKGSMDVTEWFTAKRKQIQLLASIETFL
ncbi:DUF2515 domain-containing protein [Ectobacillus sp. sgz5001026]|uniref:DUF2515 domain-containing protein n=1 Tax=Ectobacillus sp. sgz5001026 TaxID=3242473 RepID=UPI0036D3DE8D